jgi:molybdate transport system permease protein
MDWTALGLSLALAGATVLVLLPIAVVVARALAWRRFRGRGAIEALIALPLVLPPTVLGYYMLVAAGRASPLGQIWEQAFGRPLVFTFEGLLLASVVANLPFAIQPLQRAFETVPAALREAAWCSGLSTWRTFARVELPLAWPGLASAIALTFAHTLGEFGVVLMVGGNIPGETRTLAIAIYDRVQALRMDEAGIMSAALLGFSLVAMAVVYGLGGRALGRRT